MAGAIFFLALLTYCTGVRPQTSLTQAASMSVSRGQAVKLACTKSSGTSWDNDNAWYQQRPGQAPRFLHCSGCGSRGKGIPDRFTVSASGNTMYLTIANVQVEDEADYYCEDEYNTGSGWAFIFGGGTQMTVTGQPAAPPTVHLFPPSSDELTSKSKATLVCLVDDFTPGAIDVTWLADGSPITSNVETTRPTKRNDKYVASSYLSLTADKYQEKSEYTCKVTHDGKSYQKSVQREACSA